MKSIFWWRRDLVRTYQYLPEYVMMCSDEEIVSMAYRITEGF